MSSDAKASPSRAAKIWRRTWIGACMVVAVIALFSACESSDSAWPLLAVGVSLAALGVFELSRMGSLAGRGLSFPSFVALALCTTWVALDPERLPSYPNVALLFGLAIIAALAASIAQRGGEVAPLPGRVACALWLGPALPGALLIWNGYGTAGTVALVVLCKLGDVAGYYVGNAIGKHHPFPSISPGKTTAGCVGSLVAGCLAGLGAVSLGLLEPARMGLAAGLLAGATINLAAQAGDLLESAVKRRSGVKDSGVWFGPAGGALDLVDSFLLGVPMALFTWPLLFESV